MKTRSLLVLAVVSLLSGSHLILSGVAVSQQALTGAPAIERQRSIQDRSDRQGGDRNARSPDRSGRRRRDRGDGRAAESNRGPAHVAQTNVPAQPVDVILGRPTDTAVTLSVLAYSDEEGQVSYGTNKDQLTSRTPLTQLPNGEPIEIVLEPLQPNTRYCYQLASGNTDSSDRIEGSFHTQRPRGDPFVFTVQADSHLDQNTSPDVYANTIRNALADRPDFHIDLGDTFMTGKYQGDNPTELYLAQRYYFGRLCHSAPLLFTLGNHDGEPGGRGRPRTEAVLLRKKYFPNPVPDDFYTGNRREEPGIGLLQNYYAWEWGDALFVVLDPFWYTARQRGGSRDNWHRTLGEEQYRWLQATLKASQAKFKFIFIHHLVGGSDSSGRGGAEAARYFEWGGRNIDGEPMFHLERPGWKTPVHQMLVANRVSAVFHGHDHFYAKQDLDGIVYQLVPQPGHYRYGSARSAREYGYLDGKILAGSGHLRVSVSPEKAVVDYVLSVLPQDERGSQRNAAVAHSYEIPAISETGNH